MAIVPAKIIFCHTEPPYASASEDYEAIMRLIYLNIERCVRKPI